MNFGNILGFTHLTRQHFEKHSNTRHFKPYTGLPMGLQNGRDLREWLGLGAKQAQK